MKNLLNIGLIANSLCVKRIAIVATTCAVLAMLYAPKITYSGRTNRDRSYSFLFDVQQNTEVDLKQLLLNVAVVALIGSLVACCPKRLVMRALRVAAWIAVVLIVVAGLYAAILSLNALSERRRALDRAQADELYAEQLRQRGDISGAIGKWREAAKNWQIAGRAEEATAIREVLTGVAEQAGVNPGAVAKRLFELEKAFAALPDLTPKQSPAPDVKGAFDPDAYLSDETD